MDDSSDYANIEDSNLKRTRLSKSASDTPEQCNPVNTVKLWKRALQKLHSIDLDPWLDFPTHDIPVETAVRHRYSAIKKKWVIDEIHVKMESNPFDRGAMRECFRLKKLPQTGTHANDWHYASNYVVKRYISNVDRQVYFDDVRLQMEAKLWAEAFNRQAPPKKSFSS
ncbi:unnamed protein product [Dicrocoelium dendriticum]|nr:unnamed protein product [Dicrocoelium dendriticum]CAH8559261.1 unnamed protein product [Dicrocoelium dendriticum]